MIISQFSEILLDIETHSQLETEIVRSLTNYWSFLVKYLENGQVLIRNDLRKYDDVIGSHVGDNVPSRRRLPELAHRPGGAGVRGIAACAPRSFHRRTKFSTNAIYDND